VAEVLDAYALVALVADEAAAAAVEEILRSGDAVITSINLGEAADVLCRVHGFDRPLVRGVIEPMVIARNLGVITPNAADAWRAAEIRNAHYRRRARALSIADCFLLAAAGTGDRIVTADPPVADAARAEGVAVLALPDSSGRRP
jgi:predicted nucleic acid-binding protein